LTFKVKVFEQRINVVLHDPHALLPEGLPRVGPAALPEHPPPLALCVSVLQALALRQLGDAIPDVLATDIPVPA